MSIALRIIALIGAVVFIVAVAFIDIITGLIPDLTILYLIPIIIITAFAGLTYGLVIVLASTVAEVSGNIQLGLRLDIDLVLDGILHLFVFILGAVFTDRLVNQFRTITQLEQRRSYDLDIARELHKSLFVPLPSGYNNLTIGSKLAFARELGGDYYYFKIIDKKFFFCIADISGKSVAAALFSALLHANLDEALENSTDLISIVKRLNSSMHKTIPENMFVTLFCCYIDDMKLSFVNAGHEPPLLYSKRHHTIKLLESRDKMPVGIQPDLEIQPEHLNFNPGDMLLAVTDGVTESQPFREKPFEKLKDLLYKNLSSDPQSIVETVFVTAIPNSIDHLQDDVIIICIKRLP